MIRRAIGWCVGLFFVLVGARRRALARYHQNGTILSIFSHNPSPSVLEGVLRWLKKKGFTFISTDEMLDIRNGKHKWKPLLAWLTLDDGRVGFKDRLLPILHKYDVPVTIFVSPSETKRRRIWSATISRLVSDEKRREYFGVKVDDRYTYVDHLESVDSLPIQLEDMDDLITAAKDSLVTLENHTDSHMNCSEQTVVDMKTDVLKANETIMGWTGRECRLLCYPYGFRSSRHDEELISMGLIPVSSDPSVTNITDRILSRNMFTDDKTNMENIGRILQAWVKVGGAV